MNSANSPIRVTIWGENVHEQKHQVVRDLYPSGMHRCIADGLAESDDFQVRVCATLQDPEHGLSEETLAATDVLTWWGHAAHGQVDDKIVERVPAPRVGRHGADRAALGALFQNLQAPDGHQLLADVARGGRDRTALGV